MINWFPINKIPWHNHHYLIYVKTWGQSWFISSCDIFGKWNFNVQVDQELFDTSYKRCSGDTLEQMGNIECIVAAWEQANHKIYDSKFVLTGIFPHLHL